MNPANYKLSREVLQEMLDTEYNQKFHKFETIYDREVQGKSPADISQQWIDDLFVRLSDPLKKMQIDYLQAASKICYKPKHLSDSAPNLEQVLICKEAERQKVFSKFETSLLNQRDSTRFLYQDCIYDANNNVEKAVHCVRNYIRGIQQDNDKIIEQFKKDYPKYA